MKLKQLFSACVATAAITIMGVSAPVMAQSPTFDAETQAQYDAAKKVIPGLTPELFDGAKKEGAVTLYRLGYAFKAKMLPEFAKLFPFLNITEYEATADALTARYSAEARSGRPVADVVMGSLPNVYDALDKEGLVTHYTPTLADKFKPGSREGAYYPIGRYQICNAFNTDKVSAADAKLLETWDGITNPRWKSKAAIVRFGAGGIGILPYYFMEQAKGPEFLNKVMAQQPLIFASVPVMSERLAAGGIDAIFFANDANLHQLKVKGAPIQWTCPEPGLTLFTFQIIGFKAPHPNAAKLWVEFTMSDLGQQMVMSSLGFGAGRMDIEDIRPVAKEAWYKLPKDAYAFTWDAILKAQPDMQAKWTGLAGGIKTSD